MSWLVLLNSSAGARPVEHQRVAAALEGAGVAAELAAPSGSSEMRAAVVEGAAAGRPVAVVGGDGTVGLAVDALMGRDWEAPPRLGVLPAGSGCDLLRTFGISQRLEEAARHLVGDAFYRVDVGRLEGEFGRRHFLNIGQAGVGAAAAETAPAFPRWAGRVRYPLAFAARLPGFPVAEVELATAHRRYKGPALAVIFANAQFFAGGWNVAPRASLTDGRFDLQVVSCRKREAPRLVPKIVRGLHLTDRAVRRVSTEAFSLTAHPPWPVEADGDVIGNTPVEGVVLPAAIDLKI